MAEIWMISPYASPTDYGWHSRTYIIAKELVNRGHSVTVFSFLGSHYLRLKQVSEIQNIENHNGVLFHWLPSLNFLKHALPIRVINWFIFNAHVTKIIKNFKGKEPTAIVISSPSVFAFKLIRPLRSHFQSTKITLEVRDIWPLSIQLLGNYSKFNPLIYWMLRIEIFGLQNAGAIIGLMPGLHEHVRLRLDNKSVENVHFIPHSTDGNELDTFENKIPEIDEFFIGYAGTIGLANDLNSLIKALEILAGEAIYPKTLIIGDGQSFNLLIKQVKNLPNITVEKWQNRGQVLNKLKKCSICYDGFLDLKIYDYGFSRLKWVDYMLLKKPILASYSGVFAEFDINEIGWSVPAEKPVLLATKIKQLFSNRNFDEFEKKGENGFRFLKTNREVSKICDEYEKIILGDK